MKKLRKILLLLITIFGLVSCDDETIVNIITTDGLGTTTKSGSCSLIINVGDADYGSAIRTTMRTVVPDSAVKSTPTLANTIVALKEEGKTWEEHDVLNDTISFVKPGTDRGYVYAETILNNPYASTTKWQSSHSITNGYLTLNATKIGSGSYYYPVPVTFWGNYGLACFNTYRSTFTEGSSCDGTSVTTETKTIAIDHNIQYATSVFKPVVNVANNITVYSKNTGKTVKQISRDNFKFTIQYIYVHSAQSVVYGEDFAYKPSTNLVPFKYALKDNGILGKVNNGSDAFDSWNANYANLSILPTNATEVRVILVCYYMGTDNSTFVYNASKKSYQALTPGTTFYIYGKVKTDSSKKVTNEGNKLCPQSGAVGVFIPDVKTLANITISALVSDTDGNGNNDPVVIDPSESDIANYNALFNIDVEYGDMSADWSIGK